MEPARSSALLHREVVPPQRTEHGFGVLLVTSVAMFFAVASSAFILQTRALRTCPTQGASAMPGDIVPQAVDARALELYENANTPRDPDRVHSLDLQHRQRAAMECGRPVYRENPDGSVSVFFEVCPEDLVLEMSPARPIEAYDVTTGKLVKSETLPGISIRRIVR